MVCVPSPTLIWEGFYDTAQSCGAVHRPEAVVGLSLSRRQRDPPCVQQSHGQSDSRAKSNPRPPEQALRPFYRFAITRGLVRRSPLPTHAPKLDTTQDELRALLQAITPERTGRLSQQTVRALLLVLYGAGLRISEALKLEITDVDLQQHLLCIRQSKFFKSRWVPIGPKLAEVLQDYQRQRPARRLSNRRFFRANKGTPVSRSTIERIFAKLRVAAGVKRTDGGRFQPRLHDLRHAAAVHRLVSWYRKGEDVQCLLVKLSAYLGHVDIAATQKYLTWTPELRQQANTRFARYALGGSHE
jgi:integrase/recombinase XerD